MRYPSDIYASRPRTTRVPVTSGALLGALAFPGR